MIEVWPDAARYPSPEALGYLDGYDSYCGDSADRIDFEYFEPNIRYVDDDLYISSSTARTGIGPMAFGNNAWQPGETHWFGATIKPDVSQSLSSSRRVLLISNRGYSLINPDHGKPISLLSPSGGINYSAHIIRSN